MMHLDTFLHEVEARIEEALRQQAPDGLERSEVLLEAGRHLATAPGAKRARPRLVHHFGQIVGATDPDSLFPIALAAEFIHGASLLHDDVVDAGTMRRGRPTANARWNNSVAVLGGDVMLCLAIAALGGLPRQVTREAVELVATMSRAAILEVETRGDIDLSLDQWRAIAAGKTGSLFGWCGRAPAYLVEDAEAAARFERCGERLGVAFQLADDLRDLADDDSGKDRFSDIRNRNPSYPVLWAVAQHEPLREDLRALWASEHISREDALAMGLRVLETGAAETTRGAILEHVGQAFDALGAYRERSGGPAVISWAESLSRSYLGETTTTTLPS